MQAAIESKKNVQVSMAQPIYVWSYNMLIWNRNTFRFLTNIFSSSDFFQMWIISNVDNFKSGHFQMRTFSNEDILKCGYLKLKMWIISAVEIAQHEEIGF